jgi:hypothetical protein
MWVANQQSTIVARNIPMMRKITMVKELVGKRTPEVRADVLLALQGFGIFALSLVMIALDVSAAVSIPLMLALSGVCWYRWFSRRSQALQLATV